MIESMISFIDHFWGSELPLDLHTMPAAGLRHRFSLEGTTEFAKDFHQQLPPITISHSTMSSLFLFFVLSIFISSALGAPLDNVAFLLEERAAPIPINRISLQSLTYSGNGCPDGSAQSVLSDDKGALTGEIVLLR